MIAASLKSRAFFQFLTHTCVYNVKSIHRYNIIEVFKKTFKTTNICYNTQFVEKSPVIMKLPTSEFKCVITDDVKYLKNLFEENGFEIRIAGGAVRDLLLGKVPKDIDFATTATPEQMKDMFNKQKIRLINSRGESHGTITPRINDSNYEITTLRVDVVTNGRHAKVEFTTNWFMDASRRDLTINAMFLDTDGNVYDYFNGVEDLKNRRVAFVGDATSRIQEDYLRILRYFRFYGRIAEKPDNHDEATLSAIRETAQGLAIISGERIQDELFKILSGNYAIELLKTMLNLGIGPYVGLPENCNLDELERVSDILKTKSLVMDPIAILCSLLHTSEDVQNLISRLKTSAECRDVAFFIIERRNKGIAEKPLKYYQKMYILSKKRAFTKAAIMKYLAYIGDAQTLEEFGKFTCSFPVNGQDVLKQGITDARQVGFVLRELQIMWIDSNCTLTKEQLEQKIPEILANFMFRMPEITKAKKKNENDIKKVKNKPS